MLKIILTSAVILTLLDAVYLTTFSGFFGKVVKRVQGTPLKFNVMGAILCYIFIIFVLNYFILLAPKRITGRIKDAFLLGFGTYGIYELTNYAILKDWPFTSVCLDTLWGGILFATTTYATTKILAF